MEGALSKALRAGRWIVFDDIDRASMEMLVLIADVLEALNSILSGDLVLTSRGDVEAIPRHPNFRLFACMNPATDVGKKDLPPHLSVLFTRIHVPPPDDNREALVAIIEQYLDGPLVLDVADLYTDFKKQATAREIVDGSLAPHYSMRTLTRALSFAVNTPLNLRRAVAEGWMMAFMMALDPPSIARVQPLLERHLGTHPAASFSIPPGPLPPLPSRLVLTPSVSRKLVDLSRAILARYPVLIQGPTSSGKTSAIEHLARTTGHRFVRINNHEHTDLQEYLGTHMTDQSGNLVFQEGLLVTAVRQGHWIVLDELNLAPTDVLEALNRLLDDNRELLIPETGEIVKPHPQFMLFATQNPPGLYAGRKVLSRAFRNRFLEVHFDDVPNDELETILCERCQIAPSYARKIVQVFEELRHRRQTSRVFESKHSFATLRDLFRWAERGAIGYEQLARDGYMLLAERARNEEDKVVIKEVLEGVMKVALTISQRSLV
ncbi:P-loop containing nucleoside triphosphate hydrolase protein [Kockovaella imperatae]|uniref:Midasin n=1 Tax=Kockovaella imperatae TaxID=4999 RepID=A0A1Y1U7F9_9TREE|nr:P-loop containing nucleoside triphosphate hydrolase protein [Kockovaella imperatae]ORX33952.1 P-loop containing nucleoside triphosphate hydrolase protein [Kockovaella imperatae]